MSTTHHHPCQRCGDRVECDGYLERNHDGWPETICRSFHLAGGNLNPCFLCEDCAADPCPKTADLEADDCPPDLR